MITRTLVLLEGGIVFFVNDDESKIRCGRENGAASPDNDLHFAVSNALPMPMSLGIAQMTVQGI